MNMESLRMAIEILADHRDDRAEYQRLLEFVATFHQLPPATIEQLVQCHLADQASESA
jgi:hypothetical protein